MSGLSPELAVSRILDALEREIIEMPEEEIATALYELGIRPEMAGSAALTDLRCAWLPRVMAAAEKADDAQETGGHENTEISRIPPWLRR